jgi:hypothetical protein
MAGQKTLIALVAALFATVVNASENSRGPNGIDAVGLKMPDGTTNLTGDDIPVGQVETGRPPKDSLDSAGNQNSQVNPIEVWRQNVMITSADQELTDHAAYTSGIMVGSGFGVAPEANLYSSAFVTQSSAGYIDALVSLQRIATRPNAAGPRVINNSWQKSLATLTSTDGNSLLTLGVDWMASEHEVLMVFGGNQDEMRPIPTDNYNGMTIGSSAKVGTTYSKVAVGNSFHDDEDAAGDRTSIDLIAPGEGVALTGLGDAPGAVNGTSFAAPHVTGTVALLQQYGDFQTANVGGDQWGQGNHVRHEIMKAVLLNSADKKAGVHGSTRTIVSDDDTSNYTWEDSTAFTDDFQPLDMQMGAGHLNARRALTQFKSGEWDVASSIPAIGWDHHETGGIGTTLSYPFAEEVSGYVAITLAWDRQIDKIGGSDTVYDPSNAFIGADINDLDLFLVPVGWDDLLEDAVAMSISFEDNVEHIFAEVPADDYEIVVFHGGGPGTDQDYGLAWWTAGSGEPIAGDFDNDNDVDGDDLDEWRMDFAVSAGSDADGDGDSDGNDLLAWQRNLGASAAVVATTPVPEPGTSLLCFVALTALSVGRRSMNRRMAAFLVGIGVAAIAGQPVIAANLELLRNSRPVTSAEAADGAPTGGMVHDFFVTSDADLLAISPEISASVYKHRYGSNREAPDAELVAMLPAVGASSFLKLPGDTIVLGGGFTVPGSAWGDLSNDGSQNNFHFGRLTTADAGTFSGSFFVRGESVPIELPFTMSLPIADAVQTLPMSERLSLFADEPRVIPPSPVIPTGPDLNQVTSADFRGTVSIELTRRSRETTEREQKFGAPSGIVHDFYVTTSTDLISIGNVGIEGTAYQHPRGSDRKPSNDRVLRLWPASSADSFLTTPGTTRGLGKGFYGTEDAEIVWYDESDDGPLDEFLFARLTTNDTGSFAGDINVRGPNGRVTLPFQFALPGTESDMALLDQEQTYRLELAFGDSPTAQVPEPSAWLLGVIGIALFARRRGGTA